MYRYLSLLLFFCLVHLSSHAFVIDQRSPDNVESEDSDDSQSSEYEEFSTDDEEEYDPELDSEEYVEKEEYDADLDGEEYVEREEYDPDLDGEEMAAYASQPAEKERPDAEALIKNGLVEQEYYLFNISTDIAKVLQPYRERRADWGYALSFGYNLYRPADYQPNFQPDFDFDGLYSTAGLFELGFQVRRHLSFGTIATTISGGYLVANSNDKPPQESKLTVIPVRLEANVILDTLFSEPLVAPYGILGAYSMIYKEEQAGISFNGNTQVAMYFGIGANFQLNWLEPETSVRSYMKYGIENTYLYVEGKQFLSSSPESDPDFGSSFTVASGLRLEY